MSKVTVKREVFVNFYSPSPEYHGEVNRAVAPKAKAGWLRRNSALIPRSLLRGASLSLK